MKHLLLTLMICLFSLSAYSKNGTDVCEDKKLYLKSICKMQELKGEVVHFDACANGYAYEISQDFAEKNSNLDTEKVKCKMVEKREESTIKKRTTYYDMHSNRVVVYEHTSGLQNTYVYGSAGYYHISELANGDNLYNYYTFEN